MKLHLVDGTYELFRAYYAMPSLSSPDGTEVGAVRGLIQSMLLLLRQDEVTHIACAFDTEVESFRNQLFDGYKSGEGIPSELFTQFPLAERAVTSLGMVTWPMIEFEADDAIATAAFKWQDAPGMEQVVICTPDKDLAQMVQGNRVVLLDRRRNIILDEAGVQEKFGVLPESIPDYLALVGDAADRIPGISKWGAKTSAIVLSRYGHLEDIPDEAFRWDVKVRGAQGIAASLAKRREEAQLYRRLTTLRLDVPLIETLEQLKWPGVHKQAFGAICAELGYERLATLPHKWATE